MYEDINTITRILDIRIRYTCILTRRYEHTWPNDVSRSVELVRSNGCSTQILVNCSLVSSDNKDSAFSKLHSTKCCDISIALSRSVNLSVITITTNLYNTAIIPTMSFEIYFLGRILLRLYELT